MSVNNSEVPPMKRGWLRKLSRSGLMKNWQTRYFVLHNGKIAYYQDQTDRFPYGENMKGEMDLFEATVSRDPKKCSDKQLFVMGGKGQKDLLVETESAEEAKDWAANITRHIAFASRPNRESLDASMASIERSNTTNSGDDQPAGTGENDEDMSVGELVVTPKPGWVIKVLRSNGEKIFINLCEHADIPATPLVLNLGFNKWPFMIVTPARTILEDKESTSETSVYDALVAPSVVSICGKDPQAKEATCLRVMRLLKKKYGEDLQLEYKLPKINKRYKGDIQSIKIPSNLQHLSKSRSSIHISVGSIATLEDLQPTRKNSQGSAGSGNRSRSNTQEFESSAMDVSDASNVSTASEDAGQAATASSAPPQLQRVNSQPSSSATPSKPTERGLTRQLSESNTALGSYSPHSMSAATATLTALNANSGARGKPAGTPHHMEFSSRNRSDEMLTSSPSSSTPPSSSELERRSTISKLFAKASEDGRRASLSRTHTETSFDVATTAARPGTLRKSLRSSINPNVDIAALKKQQSQSQSASSLLSNSAMRTSSLDSTLPCPKKLVIPYQVIRSNGTIAKVIPDKTATGKVISSGTKVFAVARRIMPDNMAWVKTTDGWIMERTTVGSSQRVVVPTLYGQPTEIKIASTRFEEAQDGSNLRASYAGRQTYRASTSGWMGFRNSAIKENFQTRFIFDVFYQDNAVIRITRTFSEVLDLRDTLIAYPDKVLKDRALKAGSFPLEVDGEEESMIDIHLLLELVESVHAWLNKLVDTVQIDRCKCKALQEFFTPTDVDFPLMETELMAQGGMAGAWEVDEYQ